MIPTKMIYNKYFETGEYLYTADYYPTSAKDYYRVMDIIERNPEEYELVNVEYGTAWKGDING